MNYKQDLETLAAENNLRVLPPEVPAGMVNLSSNDYLGISQRNDLWQEFASDYNLQSSSMSSCSSRLLTGNHSEYVKLESTITQLYKREAALVYPSGYHTNIGILPALAGKKDVIFADKLVHASIIDGLRLSEATMIRFNHNDCDHLIKLIEKHRNDFENAFIVTESIFSMDGDIANLEQLVEIKKRFNAMLYVDEAHALGVRGKQGLGVAEELGIVDDIDLLIATFGKAIASMGAFVSCSNILKQYLVNHSRSMIFTTGLPPINVAWSNFVMQKLPYLTDERTNLQRVSQCLASKLGQTAQSHIIPFVTGSNESAVNAAANLRKQGFYVLPIRYPTVPQGKARLRFSLTAGTKIEDIQNILIH